MIKLILVATVLLGLAFAGIAVRLFLLKDGQFRKSCSSVDPNTGQKLGCTCGGDPDTACENN
ncbi:MAG: membrane or secreted protein [Bacteroidales bacterium]|nr:membrane or secreted protein [Bacteroidales bacterium]